MWRGVRCSMTLLVLTVIGNSNTRGEETPLGSVEGESGDKNMCAPKCKITYIGDRNCDPECYVEACNFDGGDCEHNWEVRRTVVLGPFFREVDFVEYSHVGPNGEVKKLTMEEGRHMEGIDVRSSEERANWRRMLQTEHDSSDFLKKTEEGRPPWFLNENGDKIPAFRTDENGRKWAINREGEDLFDEDNNRVPWMGRADGQSSHLGLNYEYDDYYEDY